MIDIIREFVTYDPLTGIFTWKYRDRKWFKSDGSYKGWNTRYAGKRCFCTPVPEGYHVGCVFEKMYYAHRVAWALVNNAWPDDEIDHDNGVRTDNRYDNLRNKTHGDNGRNQGIRPTNTSGYTGVMWHKTDKRWIARIKFQGEELRLGSYDNIAEAIAARQAAEVALGFHPGHGKRQAVPEVKHRTQRKPRPV